MKRIVVIISTFLILAGMYGENVSAGEVFWITDQTGWHEAKIPARKFSASQTQMSESDKKLYVEWTKNYPASQDEAALALSSNGWVAGLGVTEQNAQRGALANCKKRFRSSACKIVDVNGKSAFIKQKRSTTSTSTASTSSSTASSFNKVWCATPHAVSFVSSNECELYLRGTKGKAFSTKLAATAEHKRLKAARQLAKKKVDEEAARQLAKKIAEEQAARQLAKKKAEDAISVADTSVQRDFWNSIKDSDDPDEYRLYLEEYPTGKFAKLAKLRIKKLEEAARQLAKKKAEEQGDSKTTVAKSSIPNLAYGDYYALVIGNNRYDHLGDLRTPVNDVRSVANLLELDYGFNVTKLENANRSQIVKSISGLRRKVGGQDNVLIYYAGHGVLDEAADEGYWLPVDATSDDPSNWVMTDQVISQVRAMKAKHVMVVADSCFSGTITRGIKIEQRTPEWLETIVKKKSRTALTSGGLEPVMDSGGGNNSVFANSFLSILRDNDGVLDASQLFSQLRPKVMLNSPQTPEYGNIHQAGHDGGDFLFVRQ